jgi:hypothetical protein
MSNGDRYKVISHQSYQDQDVMNVFWYQQIEGGNGAQALVETFIDSVIGAIRAVQHEDLVHTSVEAINMDNEADFHQENIGSGGEGMRTGESSVPFLAWGYKLHRPTRAIRSGAKRFAGVAEVDVLEGAPNPAVVSVLDNLADVLADVIVGTEGDRWQPQIVSLNRETGEIINDIGINTASFTRITTQNSRKR